MARKVPKRIWQLGQNGGYFCGPDQEMAFPQAHLSAIQEAVAEFGTYPLQPPPVSDEP